MAGRLERIQDWEQRAAAAGFRVEQLARSVGASRQHLNRHFRTRFGLSVHQWIERLRMARACGLLMSRRTVKETAFAIGYLHPASFAHAFRRANGVAPSSLRASVKSSA
jgi:AraC-like DNA-binding protein